MRSLTHPWAAVVTSVTLIRSRSAYTYTYTDAHVCMFFFLLFWVYLTAGWLALIRSRSSYNHTYQHAYLCVCVCMYLLFFCLFFCVYLTAGGLTLCFSSYSELFLDGNKLSALPPRVFVGLSWLGWVCVFVVAEYWDTVLEWTCWFPIITWHVFSCVFSVACVCVCVFVSRCAPADKQTQ
jgi:hypothetical protein